MRIGALAVVGVFAAVFIVGQWDAIREGLTSLRPILVLASLAAIGLGLLAAMLSWRAVLSGLGARLAPVPAARVYFLGQLGKYVPGSVWPIVAQAELSRRHGVSVAQAGLAALTQMVIGLVVGIVVAGACLAGSSPEALASYWWLLPVAAAGVIGLLPPVLNMLVRWAIRLTRRGTVPQPVPGRTILASSLWCLVMWGAFGTHLWLLALDVAVTDHRLFLATSGAYALAWVVGLLIVFLPAGAGAREAALVLALAPVVESDRAIALAVVSRFLMLLGDGAAAGLAVAAARRHAPSGPRG